MIRKALIFLVCVILHFFTLCKDVFEYFKYRKWRIFTNTGIVMYGGLFGTGKTFNIVQYAHYVYEHYDNVEIYSNVTLNDIPFTPFQYLEQLNDPVPEGAVRLYLCDEFGSLFNSRNYKNNAITETEYLAILNQIRKEHKLLLISTQRWGMVDKVFRQVCKQWFECSKMWRVHFAWAYDPYDLEYTNDPRLIRPLTLFPQFIFASNKKYQRYNTMERVQPLGESISIVDRQETKEYNSEYGRYNRRYRKKA